MKSDRLLSVLMMLQAKGRATERELAERLEVSQRTIHRDLEALSAARVPVIALRGAQGGWELEKGWRTQVPAMDEAELRALLMAQPRAIGHPRLAAAAESALNKLMAALPGPMRAQAEAMRERLHVDPTGWHDSGENVSMLSVVQEAVSRERRLAFEYTRNDGQRAPRTANPLGLVAKGLHWYLVARTAQGMRTYRVSRMDEVAVLAAGFERPAGFNLEAYWKKSTAELTGMMRAYRATLTVKADLAPRLRSLCVVGRCDDTDEQGWMRVEAEFDSPTHARFVVLGLGMRARVAEPAELREWIGSEVKAMAGV
jgi:predicted DNA-binding transcriptional regulator YafY